MRVPFPFVEQERQRMRPALIISRPVGPSASLLWMLMITTARRGHWAGDVAVGPDHAQFGLPVPCVIRTAKIAALECAAIDSVVGKLPADIMKMVDGEIVTALGSA